MYCKVHCSCQLSLFVRYLLLFQCLSKKGRYRSVFCAFLPSSVPDPPYRTLRSVGGEIIFIFIVVEDPTLLVSPLDPTGVGTQVPTYLQVPTGTYSNIPYLQSQQVGAHLSHPSNITPSFPHNNGSLLLVSLILRTNSIFSTIYLPVLVVCILRYELRVRGTKQTSSCIQYKQRPYLLVQNNDGKSQIANNK